MDKYFEKHTTIETIAIIPMIVLDIVNHSILSLLM